MTRQIFLASYGIGAQIGVLLPYSRLHEREADRIGLVLMASVETIVRFGLPFERIVEYSEELDPHLIMIGSGNHKEKDFRLGSVVERVAIYASKHVWIVKLGARPTIRHLLCPVDFSDPSRRALRNAIFLSKAFQAPLSLLNVFEPLLSRYFSFARPNPIFSSWVPMGRKVLQRCS